MSELIEGINGVEVVACDFAVIGCDSLMVAAIKDHEDNLLRFLERCNQRNVKLNIETLQLRKTEAPFIGYVASCDGLKIHPDKVLAIIEMLEPEDVQLCSDWLTW